MTTTTRYQHADGTSVAKPGDYDIVGTVVRIHSTRKSNGFTVDKQDATIIHTVVARPGEEVVVPGTPEAEMTWQARAQKAEQTIADLVERFTATFQPDFGGVDWQGDQAVQDFARDFIRITHANATAPVASPVTTSTGGTR